MTNEEIKSLAYGQIIYLNVSTGFTNADGSPQRWRVAGQVKTWKRDPNRVRVPLKRGLYEYGAIGTESDCFKPDLFSLSEETANTTK